MQDAELLDALQGIGLMADLAGKPCDVEGCNGKLRARSLHKRHGAQQLGHKCSSGKCRRFYGVKYSQPLFDGFHSSVSDVAFAIWCFACKVSLVNTLCVMDGKNFKFAPRVFDRCRQVLRQEAERRQSGIQLGGRPQTQSTPKWTSLA